MDERMARLNRKVITSTIAFVAFAGLSMLYSSQQPGVTIAEAAHANRETAANCLLARELGDGPLEVAVACTPAVLKRVDTWLLFGMLVLGANMLAAGVAAHRHHPSGNDL